MAMSFFHGDVDSDQMVGDEFHSAAIAVSTEIGCACRKSNPDILVVQPAENWAAKNLPGPFDGTRERRILLQR
jgi:hypothetical protein